MRDLQRTPDEIAGSFQRNVDTVYRVCMLFFGGNRADAEDAVQTTFLKLATAKIRFRGAEHEKAWLIVTAGNVCRDTLSAGWRKRVRLDEPATLTAAAPNRRDETLESVMALPDHLKTAVYLYYYEGYSQKEIARHMGKTESSVSRYLATGRELLKRALKEDMQA